jgi:hypothetical protein
MTRLNATLMKEALGTYCAAESQVFTCTIMVFKARELAAVQSTSSAALHDQQQVTGC